MSESQITVTEQPENESMQVEANRQMDEGERDVAKFVTEGATVLELRDGGLVPVKNRLEELEAGQERSGTYDGTGRR